MSHSDVSNKEKLIKLKPNDGEAQPIKLKDARKSVVVDRLIDDLALDVETGNVEIPILAVASSTLKKVIEYLEEHTETAGYRDSLVKGDISAFDKDFVDIDRQNLLYIYNASNFLDIQMLKDLCAWAIAQLIKGKKYAVINQEWNTTNDFTEEEMHEVEHQYDWANQKMG